MNPEELETRLQQLRTPEPPDRLRRRVLRGGRFGWRAMGSVAAALLGFGLVLWIALKPPAGGYAPAQGADELRKLVEKLGHDDPAVRDQASERLAALGLAAEAALREAERNPDPEIATRARSLLEKLDIGKRMGRFSTDPKIRAKLARVLKEHPGKAVILVPGTEFRDGVLGPARPSEFRLSFVARRVPETPEGFPITGTGVDEDGHVVYIVEPGKIVVGGYSLSGRNGRYFAWSGFNGPFDVEEALLLPPFVLSPLMKWTGPAAGVPASLKGDPAIEWEACPGAVRIVLDAVLVSRRDEAREPKVIANLDVDPAKGNRVALGVLVKASREALQAGDWLELTLRAFGPGGVPLSGGNPLRIELGE